MIRTANLKFPLASDWPIKIVVELCTYDEILDRTMTLYLTLNLWLLYDF